MITFSCQKMNGNKIIIKQNVTSSLNDQNRLLLVTKRFRNRNHKSKKVQGQKTQFTLFFYNLLYYLVFISQLHSNMLLTLFYDNIICLILRQSHLFFNTDFYFLFFIFYFLIKYLVTQAKLAHSSSIWFGSGQGKKVLKSKSN